MKKTFKKALCVLLTLIMLTSAVSASAAALDLNGLAYDFTLSADGTGMILTKCTNSLIFEENVVNLLDYIGPRSCFQPRFMASGVNLILSNLGIGTCFQPRFVASGVNLVVSLH